MIPLSPDTERHLVALFAGESERQRARHLLEQDCAEALPWWNDPSPKSLERVRFAVLKLSDGSIPALARALAMANVDWRDVLIDAGFADEGDAHLAWRPGPPVPAETNAPDRRQHSIGRWLIECDRAATIACHAALPAELDCTCADCRNFTAARDRAFPAEFRAITNQLGVDLTKPAELAHYGREPSGLHLVGGWYHFVGAIHSGADAWSKDGRSDFERSVDGLKFGFTSMLWPVAEPFRRHRVAQLEFVTRVPWVLDEPEAK